MIEPRDFIGIAGVPVIQGMVAIIKKIKADIPAGYIMGISIACGVILNAAIAFIVKLNFEAAVFTGFIAGLIASGVYTVSKLLDIVATSRKIALETDKVNLEYDKEEFTKKVR